MPDDLVHCEWCLKRAARLSGFSLITEMTAVTRWFFCSEECKDAFTKNFTAWTPNKTRANLSRGTAPDDGIQRDAER